MRDSPTSFPSKEPKAIQRRQEAEKEECSSSLCVCKGSCLSRTIMHLCYRTRHRLHELPRLNCLNKVVSIVWLLNDRIGKNTTKKSLTFISWHTQREGRLLWNTDITHERLKCVGAKAESPVFIPTLRPLMTTPPVLTGVSGSYLVRLVDTGLYWEWRLHADSSKLLSEVLLRENCYIVGSNETQND